MEENSEISVIETVISNRHIPYRLENGELITQDNIILIIDQHGTYHNGTYIFFICHDSKYYNI